MDRRRFLTGTGATLAGALAGCQGSTTDAGSQSTSDATTNDATTTKTTEQATTESETEAESYTVSMVPVGDVTFDSVPEMWVANNGSWADMGVALGLEPPKGVWLTARYHTQYYDDIPGVSVDKSNMKSLWGDSGVGKEQFYALDADVHVVDPNFLRNRGQWAQKDVDEIATNVGPFFGNSSFSRSYPWHEDYRYYSLMEAFEKLSAVFQRTDRYDAFEQVHADFQAALAPVVPARSERPEVAVVWGSGSAPEQFYPYIIDEGTSYKHLHDLKVRDALADSDVKNFHENRGAIDYETLLEIDPNVLLVRGQETKTAGEFQDSVVSFMEDHQVASQLTAVQHGDVYRAGGLYQGPITNLVLTERLARDLYGVEDDLFDRQRVADIVHGEF